MVEVMATEGERIEIGGISLLDLKCNCPPLGH